MPTPEELYKQFKEELRPAYDNMLFFTKEYENEKDIPVEDLPTYRYLQKPEFSELKKHIKAIKAVFDDGVDDINEASPEKASEYLEGLQYLNSFIEQMSKAKNRDMDSVMLGKLKELQDSLNSPASKNVFNAMKLKVELVEKYNKGYLKDEIEEKKNNYHPDGVKPSIDECLNMSIYNTDADTVFERLIWLAKYESIYQQFYDVFIFSDNNNSNDNIYFEAYKRINDELDNALPEQAMQYAEKMLVYRIAGTNTFAQQFNEYKNDAPDGTNPDLYANYQIIRTNEFEEFTKSLTFTVPLNMGAIAKASKGIGEALPGHQKLYEVIINDDNDDPIRPSQDDYKAELAGSGFDIDKNLNSVVRLYESLLKDGSPKSKSFMKMQKSLQEFLNLNHDGSVPEREYMKKLFAAERDSQKYFESHKGKRFTKNGVVRRDIANAIADNLKLYKEKAPGLQIDARKKAWREVLFSKPGITKEEKDLINKFATGNDYHNRTVFFAYVVKEITQAKNLDDTNPKVAKYKELMGKIGHGLEIEMKKSGFEIDKEQAAEFKYAVDALSNLGPKKENVKAVDKKAEHRLV